MPEGYDHTPAERLVGRDFTGAWYSQTERVGGTVAYPAQEFPLSRSAPVGNTMTLQHRVGPG